MTIQHAAVDVVIVGAGAGGGITAMTLAERGLRVVCLEQGAWVIDTDRPHASLDWEWTRQAQWALSPNVRRRKSDYPVETDDSKAFMWNAVGGSTNLYTGTWPRYRPSDFRKGTEHGLAPDWPISYEDLVPFWQKADEDYGISGVAGDPAMPPDQTAFPSRPLPRGENGRLNAAALDKLGWHWWPMPTSIIADPYRGRPGCNNSSACFAGCDIGAIGNTAVTHWPRAIAAGAELRTNARVERVETNDAGRAIGASYIDTQTGQRHFQPASVVVVACNGIGTPRLLLMSKSERFPNGLANSSDQVGRNLMHHTLGFVDMWVDAPTESFMGAIATPIICEEFAETDVSRGFVNGITLHFIRQQGAGFQALGAFSNNRAPWGKGHHEHFRRHFGHGMTILVYGDDLPHPDNRITLSETETDSSGLPAAKLDYKPSENDRRLSDWGLERAVDVARALGAFDVKVNNLRDASGHYRPNAWHLLGTARMGKTADMSVVNAWQQSWDVPNLFIIDGSVMTTGGAINPTSTISALSYRAAENLADRFAIAARGASMLA